MFKNNNKRDLYTHTPHTEILQLIHHISGLGTILSLKLSHKNVLQHTLQYVHCQTSKIFPAACITWMHFSPLILGSKDALLSLRCVARYLDEIIALCVQIFGHTVHIALKYLKYPTECKSLRSLMVTEFKKRNTNALF